MPTQEDATTFRLRRVTDKPTPQGDPTERACRAYFRSGGIDEPASAGSGEETVGERKYVVLRNVRGILAVYRIKTDGVLKRLERWPKELDEWPGGAP
jgi:hypothetical protein